MRWEIVRGLPIVAVLLVVGMVRGHAHVHAQQPGEPGSGSPLGAIEAPDFNRGAPESGTLGGPAGSGFPRVPPSITRPGRGEAAVPDASVSPPSILPAAELPTYGTLSLPGGPEDEGPPGGLTLDAAIERLVRENLELRARSYEIPQAQADILTASLRANPIFYADVQMVPYGSFSGDRNGGPTQYDVNVSIPLDLSHKRQARMAVAGHARRVVEAQYQDAVRLTIDNLYTAYVDTLAARETTRFAEASRRGLEELVEPLRRRLEEDLIAEAEVNRARVQLDFARIALDDAHETYLKTQHALAALLNIPPGQAETLELRGSVHQPAPPLPAADALVRLALQCRPDLNAYRLGVQRSHAEVRLAEANRWGDIYWLVQPYTYQDLRPFDAGDPSVLSWATGVTVPLPLSDRNQGNIRRARANVTQTRTELAALERGIISEVIQADKDYRLTSEAVRRVEADLLPVAGQVLASARLNFERGETDVVAYLAARREFNDVIRQYRDFLVRHRRSMLRLNTAVGRRVLP